MRLLVLGSAAAEAIPGVFCRCRVCDTARREGGREIRSRTAYMLGDEVRVDFGHDAFWHTVRYGLDHTRLRHLLFTHSHGDHMDTPDLWYRKPGFCQVPEDAVLHIWGNEHVVRRIESEVAPIDALRIVPHLMRAGEPVELMPGFQVMPLEASHASEDEQALNLAIQTPGGTVLIGNDTGYYPESTWALIPNLRLDIAFIDSTYGTVDSCGGHMGLPWVVKTRDRMAALGALNPGCRVIANHFSHNGGATHSELVEAYQPHGIEVAYDGMEIEL